MEKQKKNFLKFFAENPQRFKMANVPEPRKKLKKTQSVPTNLNQGLSEDQQFKAKPFPKSIFTDFAYEQIREDERYRSIRKALRQKALLSSSKLPPRMQEDKDKMVKEPSKVIFTFTSFSVAYILFHDITFVDVQCCQLCLLGGNYIAHVFRLSGIQILLTRSGFLSHMA